MSLIWLILIAVVIVFLIYEAIHRFLVKRATLIVQKRAQTITNRIVLAVLNDQLQISNCDRQSQLVSDIWGKGVLSFEYNITITEENQRNLEQLSRSNLEAQINQQAQRQGIDYFDKAQGPFKITDWWQGKKRFHMDVTYLMNEASYEYVHDLKKLGE